MGVIDMFTHPVNRAVEADLLDLSARNWPSWTAESLAKMDSCGIDVAGVCVMDERILDRQTDLQQLAAATQTRRLWFTLMPDFRRQDAPLRIEQAAMAGFKGITFHSYLQEIAASDYHRVVALAEHAESVGLFNGICTAYGSKRMFEYQSLPLAAEMAKRLSGPILLYHNGGSRVLEALLLCEMWPALYLETSFSLSYWMGSSVETDLAFAIRKLAAHRVMFGSDSPFHSQNEALRDHDTFFRKHGFTAAEQGLILGGSAREVFPFLTNT